MAIEIIETEKEGHRKVKTKDLKKKPKGKRDLYGTMTYKSKDKDKKATGGRVGLKHGSYKTVPLSHADIAKYVTKRGKSEGPKGEDTNYRRTEEQKKGTTLTMKTAKRKMGPAGRPAGGWTT